MTGLLRTPRPHIAEPPRPVRRADVLQHGGGHGDETAGAPCKVMQRAASSPYKVLGDLMVPPGATLRLEPGVEGRFARHDALKSGKDSERVELRLEGKRDASCDSGPKRPR